ncbi:MAG: ABC transporter permease [Planctomycetota bacterium]
MVNIPVIAKRELNAYFLSPIAYIVLTAFALTHGLIFSIHVGSAGVDPDAVVRFIFWTACGLMIIGAPIITMRLISQEQREGTIEPLLTVPVSDVDVITGKFLGSLIFSTSLMLPILLELVFLSAFSSLDYGPVFSGFLGLYLLINQFLAIGLFCSALTRVQIGAAIITFVSLVALFLLWLLFRNQTSNAAAILRYCAPGPHFSTFVRGVIDTRDLVYFMATTALFLFLSVQIIASRKWK